MQAPCKLTRLLSFAILALLLISLLPLTAPINPTAYSAVVMGYETNFFNTVLILKTEFRLYPILAACCFGVGFLVLNGGWGRRWLRFQPFFFFGLGFLSYAMFRFLLVNGFAGEPQWYNFWEELSELMMVTGLLFALILFRKNLGLRFWPFERLKLDSGGF